MFDYVIGHCVTPNVWCPDGKCSVWAALKAFPGAEVIGATYLNKSDRSSWVYPEFKKGDRVLVVDFTYPIEVLN